MPRTLNQTQNYSEKLEHPWNEIIENTFDKKDVEGPQDVSSWSLFKNNRKKYTFSCCYLTLPIKDKPRSFIWGTCCYWDSVSPKCGDTHWPLGQEVTHRGWPSSKDHFLRTGGVFSHVPLRWTIKQPFKVKIITPFFPDAEAAVPKPEVTSLKQYKANHAMRLDFSPPSGWPLHQLRECQKISTLLT